MLHEFLDRLDEHTLVLTQDTVAAAVVRQRHAELQIDAGRVSWPTPDVVTLRGWVTRVWQTQVHYLATGDGVLISGSQEHLLWEQIIASNLVDDGHGLLVLRGAARHAQQAYELHRCWRLPAAGVSAHADAQAFNEWRRRFERRLKQEHWVTQADALVRLPAYVASGDVALPRRIQLVGVHELSPAQDALLSALARAGVELRWPQSGESSKPRHLTLENFDAELEAAARFARSRAFSASPGCARVVVAVPGLTARRASLRRVFEEVFQDQAAQESRQARFDIAAGEAITHIPIVRDALAALSLNRRRIDMPELEQVIGSAYLAGADDEQFQRASLTAVLRALGEVELPLTAILSSLHSSTPGAALTRALNGFYELVRGAPRRQSSGEWGLHFSRQLRAIGWPGRLDLSDSESEAVAHFERALDALSALSLVAADLCVDDALRRLRSLCAETIITPRHLAAPVLVVDIDHCHNLTCDALWVLGLNETDWPRAARPNPFLPMSLQHGRNTPHSSTSWEYEAARTQLAVCCSNASEVVVSSARFAAERSLRVSSMLRDCEEVELDALALPDYQSLGQSLARIAVERDYFTDSSGPPLPEATRVRGGTGILKSQSACPFQAFARYRLGARGLGQTGIGLDPLARGSLAHDALEAIWARLGDQHTLLSCDQAELSSHVAAAVERALSLAREHRPHTVKGKFEALETTRLAQLLEDWLALEKNRSPFKVVSFEASSDYQIEGLPLGVRPDRLDEVEGGLLVIDYKTGNPRVAEWLDERIDEPQLPLYCTALDERGGQPVVGTAFGVVNGPDSEFRGLAENAGLANGITTVDKSRSWRAGEHADWSSLKQHWRQRLVQLADEFVGGVAVVRPKSEQVCRYCDLASLCRIHDAGPDPERPT